MNKNAIKKFAVEARKKLIASVSDKAGMLGITPEGCSEPVTKGADFEVYKTIAGTEVTLSKTQCEQRRKLKEQVETRGFEAVVEEVAYTWFNRICAIRFMEVNDYLPTRVRVLSSEKEGKNEPDIVTQAPDVELDFTDKEREYILDCKINNKLDELFKMLFIKQCNKLSEILPELFEATEDYTEMLLNISYTNKDDIIYMLVNPETGIPEADFNVSTIGEDGQPTGQVEIIGWLYQYYNTELKDDTFAQLKKNIKISKERIPAATQLFTPDWIVRYMVENSVGRLWIEHLCAVDSTVNEKEVAEKFGWKYYLPEAEQEADVNVKLAEIRTSYKDLKPEDITCIDPCMGSGHILVAMFDVLMDIYKSAGYSERDAAFEIVEHNIHGLDIDKRAYQLAYFAVMMKGRGYNRRFLSDRNSLSVKPKVYVFEESNNVNRAQLKLFGQTLEVTMREKIMQQMNCLLDIFENAKEYGSILNIDMCDWEVLSKFVDDLQIDGQMSFENIGSDETQKSLRRIINVAKTLGEKYDVVVTNPPYMGASGMGANLLKYVKDNYPVSKADMFAVFIEKAMNMTKFQGYQMMITQQMFMFLPTYEKLREHIFENAHISSMVHLGYGTFGADFGTTAFCIRKGYNELYVANYISLSSCHNIEEKEKLFDEVLNDLSPQYHHKKSVIDFCDLPGKIIAFWLTEGMENIFRNDNLKNICDARIGLVPGNNEHYLRYWTEVNYKNIGLNCTREEARETKKRWFPYNKGGAYRKWYGNRDYVVDWYDDGYEMQNKKHPSGTRIWAHNFNLDYIFKKHIAWSDLTSGDLSFRMFDDGFLFDSSSDAAFVSDELFDYLLAYLNTDLVLGLTKILNPTIHFKPGDFLNLPFKVAEECVFNEISSLSRKCVDIAREDWDSFEVSWDFKKHPLCGDFDSIFCAYTAWEKKTKASFEEMKESENRIEKLFLQVYDLENEFKKANDNKMNCVRVAVLEREIKSFISYAVGCMFGRYSLAKEGVMFAGGQMTDVFQYCSKKNDESGSEGKSYYYLAGDDYFIDGDNVIPITDEEYFSDDIVSRFIEFIKRVYGSELLEENLDFIAKALGNKGNTSREIIRNYFLKDFYLDHLKIYQKRPIYWLFDSGKQNGFKALIYIHRYDIDLVGRVRTDYLHKTQKYVEAAMQSAQYTLDNSVSTSEKAKATKAVTKYTKQLAEMKTYDEAMAHIANQRIDIDLDDGVKVNYVKFQGVEVAQEGKKSLRIDLLTKI